MNVMALLVERRVHERRVERHVARLGAELRDVDGALVLGADDDRHLELGVPQWMVALSVTGSSVAACGTI